MTLFNIRANESLVLLYIPEGGLMPVVDTQTSGPPEEVNEFSESKA